MSVPQLLMLASINVDLAIEVPDVPKAGETVYGSNFKLNLGGKGANQAYYAAQFKTPTKMVAMLGEDPFADFALDELNQTNIELISSISTKPTGKAIIILSQNDNRIILEPGANADLTWNQVEPVVNNSDIQYVGAVLEIPFATVHETFRWAKSNGATTFLNAAPAVVADQAIYSLTDYLFVNETEAQTLSGLNFKTSDLTAVEQVADWFLNQGVKKVVITLGADGSFYKDHEMTHFVPSEKVKVVTTTGAGDAYVGAFMSEIIAGKTVEQTMQFATSVAAKVCQHHETQVEVF